MMNAGQLVKTMQGPGLILATVTRWVLWKNRPKCSPIHITVKIIIQILPW
jgi:hypothetical protein